MFEASWVYTRLTYFLLSHVDVLVDANSVNLETHCHKLCGAVVFSFVGHGIDRTLSNMDHYNNYCLRHNPLEPTRRH